MANKIYKSWRDIKSLRETQKYSATTQKLIVHKGTQDGLDVLFNLSDE
jgi:hypothetical protein